MGYEIGRFEGDVDEELICPICSGVMEEPLQVEFKAWRVVTSAARLAGSGLKIDTDTVIVTTFKKIKK